MAQGRPRRKTVVLSSDDQDDTPMPRPDANANDNQVTPPEQEATSTKPRTALSSKPKPSAPSNAKVAKSPAQPRQSRQKSKPIEAQPKRANKSIFSFFNPATQRQQASEQDSASSTKSIDSTPNHQDIDDDISGDDTAPSLSQTSQTAQSLRKRKLNKDDVGHVDGSAPLPPSQKFRKISNGTRLPTATRAAPAIQDARPWTERFAPVNISELAVHPRKVADVRSVLQSALSDRARPRLIVLKGAAGTAKTTTVSLLAKEMGMEILEWKNPVGTDASSGAFASYSSHFQEFVSRSAKFIGLDLVQGDGTVQQAPATKGKLGALSGKQMMLVEEFPDTFARNSPALHTFRDTIQQYLAAPASSSSSPTPMVMVVSEALLSTTTASADSFTAHRLLGPAILNHPQTAQIEFNNIAVTILTKALDTVVVKESRKSGRRFAPGPGVLKRLAEYGDVRSAVSALEFLCLAGDDSETWSTKVAFTKPKGRPEAVLTKKEQDALQLVNNRESSLGIFHAVGRVIYNKRIDPPNPIPQPPTHFPQHRKPKVPEHDPNDLIDEVGTDTTTFIAALQENYALSCASSSSEDAMDSLNGCIDALSDSDMLSCDRFGFGTRAYSGSAQDNIRQDDMSFQTAVRGLLFWLPSPVNRVAGLSRSAKRGDEYRMFFPSEIKLWKQKEGFEDTLESVMSTLHTLSLRSNSSLASTDQQGVASWQRHKVSASDVLPEHGTVATETALPLTNALLSTSAKTETLLERLPYAAQILPHRKNMPQSLVIGVNALTRISGQGLSTTALDEEQADTVEDPEVDSRQSEWTDRPDIELRSGKTKGPQKPEFEGGGLHIPVEHAVEKLVLSDDDIEDD